MKFILLVDLYSKYTTYYRMSYLTKKIIIFLIFLYVNSLFPNQFEEIIEKNFSNRKLDTIEGLWKKTYANQGATGCITMFYKIEEDFFNQIHVASCFVIDKVTGKQKKVQENVYKGENAIYYYDRDAIWEPSTIKISENINSFSITHEGVGNTFTEQWKRVWPKDINAYNKNLNN